MKKTAVKTAIILIALALACAVLFACAEKSSAVVVTYNVNGGVINPSLCLESEGKSEYSVEIPDFTAPDGGEFAVAPISLPENGYFSREGYLLCGYSRSPGGEAEIGLGSKFKCAESVTLYCVWVKYSDSSLFEYIDSYSGDGICITAYKGGEKTVAVPNTINGRAVTEIEEYSFNSSQLETLYLPKTIETVWENALYNCINFKKLVIFDTLFGLPNDFYYNCPEFSDFRINSARNHSNAFGWSNAAMKIDCLLTAEGKKLIFAGGSGTLWGVDSAFVKASFPDYAVINYGTDSATSISFLLDVLEGFIGEGDVIVHCPELMASQYGSAELGMRDFEVFEYMYDALRYIDIRNYTNVFNAYSLAMNAIRRVSPIEEYGYINFETSNVYCDNTNRGEPNGLGDEYYKTSRKEYLNNLILSDEGAARLNSLYGRIKSEGGEMYIAFAPITEYAVRGLPGQNVEAYDGNREEVWSIFDNAVDAKLTAPLLYGVGHSLMKGRYFSNSIWHLCDEGAAVHTQRLVEILKTKLESK